MEELQAGGAAGRWKEEAGEEEEDSSGRVEKAVEFKERMTPVSSVISSTTLNDRNNEAAAAAATTVEVRGGSFSSSSDPVRPQAVTAKKGRPPQLFSQAVAPSSTEQGGVFGNLSQRQDNDNDNDDVVKKKKKLPAKQNPSTSTHDAPPHPQGGGLPRPTYRRPQQEQQQQQESSYDYDSSVGGAAASGMTLKKKKKKKKMKEPAAGVVVVPADQDFSMITHAGERSPSSSFFSNELGIPPHLQAPPDHHQDFSMITQAGERPAFDEFGIPLHLKASPDHHHQDFSMITQAGEKPSFDEFGIPLHLENSSGGGRGGSRNIQDFSIISTHRGDEPDQLSSFGDPRLFSSYQSSFNQRAGANGGYQDQYSTPDVGDVPLYKLTRPGKQQQQQQHQQGLRHGHTMPAHHDKGQQQIGYWEALEAEEHAHPVMQHKTRHHATSLPRTARYQSYDNQIPEMYKRAPPHKFAESPRSPNFEAAPAPRRSPGPRYYEGPGHRAAAAAGSAAWEDESAMDSDNPDRINTVQYGMRQNHRGKTSTQWKKITKNPDVVCCTIL
jgi:hypothetical protein